MIGVTPVCTTVASSSKLDVALKNGSYCLTGVPLLLKTVRPVPTQRGTVGVCGSGSACTLIIATRPNPSEYVKLCWNVCGAGKVTCCSRAVTCTKAGLPLVCQLRS